MDLMQLHPKVADDSGDLLRQMEPQDASEQQGFYSTTDMPTEMARVAMSEVLELLEAAEAKAMYGLAINWKPLQALTEALLDRGVLQVGWEAGCVGVGGGGGTVAYPVCGFWAVGRGEGEVWPGNEWKALQALLKLCWIWGCCRCVVQCSSSSEAMCW
jgi:hypothetical protein